MNALILINKINAVFLTQEKITQTSGANSEYEHSEIQRFWALNKRISLKDSVFVSCQ